MIHVRASEQFSVDALNLLVHPRVVLWLETDSNSVKASTWDVLRRFDSAYVRLRAPVLLQHVRDLARHPQVGVFADAAVLFSPLGSPSKAGAVVKSDCQFDAGDERCSGSMSRRNDEAVFRRLGARPVVLQVEGALDENVFEQISHARPRWVHWKSPKNVDLLSYGFFRQMPGRALVSFEPERMVPFVCDGRPNPPSLKVHLATLLALPTPVFPCGANSVVTIDPQIDRWLLQSLLAANPGIELEINVGRDELALKNAAALLEELYAPPP